MLLTRFILLVRQALSIAFIPQRYGDVALGELNFRWNSNTIRGNLNLFDLSVFELFLPLITEQTVTIVDNALSLIELPSHTINRYQSQGVAPLLINTVPSAMDALVAAEAIRVGNDHKLSGRAVELPWDRLYAIPAIQCVQPLRAIRRHHLFHGVSRA